MLRTLAALPEAGPGRRPWPAYRWSSTGLSQEPAPAVLALAGPEEGPVGLA